MQPQLDKIETLILFASRNAQRYDSPLVDEGELSVDAVAGDELGGGVGATHVAAVGRARHLQPPDPDETAVTAAVLVRL